MLAIALDWDDVQLATVADAHQHVKYFLLLTHPVKNLVHGNVLRNIAHSATLGGSLAHTSSGMLLTHVDPGFEAYPGTTVETKNPA